MLVHGHSKVGKTTFAATAPYPRLLLDVESASRFLPIVRKVWNPALEEPPVADGTWDTCVVYVRDYQTVTQVYAWLQSGKHQFKSVILDSISELQVRLKEQIAGRGQLQTQQWGEVLTALAGLMRDFRDLTMHATNPLEAIVLTAMTQQKDGIWRPYLQGQLATVIPYFWDVTGYLYVDQVQPEDPTAAPVETRRMLTRKHPLFEAGERVQGRVPPVVDNPRIDTMLDMIFGPAVLDVPPAPEAPVATEAAPQEDPWATTAQPEELPQYTETPAQ